MDSAKHNESDKYKKMYKAIMKYEEELHEKNQRRIRMGLKLLILIPLFFLVMLFVTGSSKIIFLVLWIVSLFIIAAYLVIIEYLDCKIQENLIEYKDDDAEVGNLIGRDLETMSRDIQKAKKTINTRIEEWIRRQGEEDEPEDEEHS